MYPNTLIGRVFSGCVFLWSIIMVVLPMAIIGSNFAEVYTTEGLKDGFKKSEEKRLFRIYERNRRDEEYERKMKERLEYEERKKELEAKLSTSRM